MQKKDIWDHVFVADQIKLLRKTLSFYFPVDFGKYTFLDINNCVVLLY